MPNHVRNVLKFSKLSAKDKEFILNQFTTEIGEDGIYPLNRYFDFDKIIAEPRKKESDLGLTGMLGTISTGVQNGIVMTAM